jgi:hypothetical protein
MIDRKSYMRMGAEARIKEISAELEYIWRLFPDLRNGRAAVVPGVASAVARTRQRRPMSPAQRKAVSEWMRRYWAKRRAGK